MSPSLSPSPNKSRSSFTQNKDSSYNGDGGDHHDSFERHYQSPVLPTTTHQTKPTHSTTSTTTSSSTNQAAPAAKKYFNPDDVPLPIPSQLVSHDHLQKSLDMQIDDQSYRVIVRCLDRWRLWRKLRSERGRMLRQFLIDYMIEYRKWISEPNNTYLNVLIKSIDDAKSEYELFLSDETPYMRRFDSSHRPKKANTGPPRTIRGKNKKPSSTTDDSHQSPLLSRRVFVPEVKPSPTTNETMSSSPQSANKKERSNNTARSTTMSPTAPPFHTSPSIVKQQQHDSRQSTPHSTTNSPSSVTTGRRVMSPDRSVHLDDEGDDQQSIASINDVSLMQQEESENRSELSDDMNNDVDETEIGENGEEMEDDSNESLSETNRGMREEERDGEEESEAKFLIEEGEAEGSDDQEQEETYDHTIGEADDEREDVEDQRGADEEAEEEDEEAYRAVASNRRPMSKQERLQELIDLDIHSM